MANPETPADISASAAEIRRRLLASTPPPLASGGGETDEMAIDEAAASPVPEGYSTWGNTTPDLTARLKMPGKAEHAKLPEYPLPEPEPPPRPIHRPTPGSRIAGLDAASVQHADHGESNGRQQSDEVTRLTSDVKRYKSEIRELRKLLEEMKQLLQEASETEQRFVAKEKDFHAALEAKDAQINDLNSHLGQIEDQIARGELAPPPPIPKTRTELEEWADELEKESAKLNKERNRLNEDRRQLQEDEEALEKQMREMEVSMARERALIARQETELKRLSAEIQHELDMMQRGDASLREQMQKFQRRATEVMTNKPNTGFGSGGSGPHKQPPPRR